MIISRRGPTPMNSSIGGPDPAAFSSRLGTLAASLHAAPPRITDANQPTTFGPRLAALLASLRRRQQAHETFKANHFINADYTDPWSRCRSCRRAT